MSDVSQPGFTPKPTKQPSQVALILIIAILAVALVAVGIFAYSVTRGSRNPEIETTTTPPTTTIPTPTPTPTLTPTLVGLACEGGDNSTWLLSLCGSGDESMDTVAVSGNGIIFAAGQTTSTDGVFASLPATGDTRSYLALFDDKTATDLRGDIGNINDIKATPDGGVITVGDAGDNHTATLVKYDADGAVAWQAHYSVRGTFSSFSGVAVADDGTIVAIGQTSPVKNGVAGDPTESFIAKYNASGKRAWLKHDDLMIMRMNGLPSQIAIGAKGVIVLAGTKYANFDSPDLGLTHSFTYTLTSSGAGQAFAEGGGSNAVNAYYDVIATPKGDFMAVGMFCSADSGLSPGGRCTGVMSEVTAKTGSPVTSCYYQSDYPSRINAVAITPTGDYVVAGATTQANSDAMIALVSRPTGMYQPCPMIWGDTFGGPGDDSFQDVTVLPNGDIVAVGQTSSKSGDLLPSMGGSDAFIIKLTADGDTIAR